MLCQLYENPLGSRAVFPAEMICILFGPDPGAFVICTVRELGALVLLDEVTWVCVDLPSGPISLLS